MRYHTEFVVSAMEQKMVGFNLEEYVMERLAYNIAAGVMKKAHAIKRTDSVLGDMKFSMSVHVLTDDELHKLVCECARDYVERGGYEFTYNEWSKVR